MKILLADDDEELCEALRECLVAAGHTVSVARNGRDACNLMQRERIEALVTDILMPEQDGLEVIMRFRHLFPKATVVAMSGGSELLGGQFCLDLASRIGADTVLKKPFMFSELVRAVERA